MRNKRRLPTPVTPELMREILRLDAYKVKQTEIALRLNVSQATVSRVCRGLVQPRKAA